MWKTDLLFYDSVFFGQRDSSSSKKRRRSSRTTVYKMRCMYFHDSMYWFVLKLSQDQ